MLLLRKVLRTMMETKAQQLGAFFMVLISSMLIVSMNTVAGNLASAFDTFAANNRLGDAEFAVDVELDTAAAGNRLDALVEQGSVVDYELQPGQTLRIFAENNTLNLHAVIQGQDLAGGDILIDPLFAAANGLKIGDTLRIGGQAYAITGMTALPNFIYVVRSKEEMINDPKAFGVAVMSRQDVDRLPGKSDFYAVRFNLRQSIHEQELQFKDFLLASGANITRWESTTDNVRVSYVDLEVQTLSTMSRVVPGMLLVLSIVLISILLRRMIQRESTVIGALSALGYRRAELLRHYLVFPALIGGLGGFLGALFGVAMSKIMLNFFMTTVFLMPVDSYHYNPVVILAGLLTPLVVLCLASYLAMVRLLRTSPAELMKGARVSDKLNAIERALKLDRFRFDAKFQIREQVRNPARTLFLLFGVIVATMLLLYGLTLQSSLDYMLNEGIAELYNLKFEYVYNEPQTSSPPPGTEQFSGLLVTPKHDKSFNFYIAGVLPETDRIRLKDLTGAKLIPEQVVVTKMLADKLRVGVGNVIQVIDNKDLREYTLTIDALADSAAGEFIFMPLAEMNAMIGAPADSYSGIWTDEPMTFPEGVLSSTKSIDAVAAGIRNLISQSGIMVYTLTIAAFILGLIIIFLVTGMIVEENRITISLFKVLGYRHKEVNRLILDSNTVVVAFGYLLGIPVLLASVTALMQSLAGSMQMTIPTRLNIWYMLFGFVVVMLAYEVAKLLSRKKVNRIPMSEALKAGSE